MFLFLVTSRLFGLRDSLTGMSVGCFRDLSTGLCVCACLSRVGGCLILVCMLRYALVFSAPLSFFAIFHRQSARYVILASVGEGLDLSQLGAFAM